MARARTNPWKAREVGMARRYWNTDEYDGMYDDPQAQSPKRCARCGHRTAWYKATVGAFVCRYCGKVN